MLQTLFTVFHSLQKSIKLSVLKRHSTQISLSALLTHQNPFQLLPLASQ